MKRTTIMAVAVLTVVGAGWVADVAADSSDADCQVRRKGDVDKGASGPCTFSQRQGNVDITLKNGGSYSLTAGDRPNHFKDQNGHGVERTAAGGSSQTYKWEHMQVVVTFGGAASGGGATAMGGTPADLKDLVHGSLVGGEVEDAMTKRGYKHVKDEASGEDVYSYWKSAKGDCVTVRLNKSRHVESIVSGPAADCQ